MEVSFENNEEVSFVKDIASLMGILIKEGDLKNIYATTNADDNGYNATTSSNAHTPQLDVDNDDTRTLYNIILLEIFNSMGVDIEERNISIFLEFIASKNLKLFKLIQENFENIHKVVASENFNVVGTNVEENVASVADKEKCKDCPKICNNKLQMREHMVRHYRHQIKKKYITNGKYCTLCENKETTKEKKKIWNTNSLLRHIALNHEKINEIRSERGLEKIKIKKSSKSTSSRKSVPNTGNFNSI